MAIEYESVQTAMFTTAPPSKNALQLWTEMFGEGVGSFQTHSPSHTQASGEVDGLVVTFVVQNERIDCVIVAPTPANEMPPQPIPNVENAIMRSLSCVERIAPQVVVGRIAAVLQSNDLATSLEGALERFRSRFPNMGVPGGAVSAGCEFVVPMFSRLNPNRRILRICKWNTVQSLFFQIPNGAAPGAASTRYSAHGYVDVYAETMETMSTPDVVSGMEELVREALRIIDGGPEVING